MMMNLKKLMTRTLRKAKIINRSVMKKIFHMFGPLTSIRIYIYCRWIQLSPLAGSKAPNVISKAHPKNVQCFQPTSKKKSRVRYTLRKRTQIAILNQIMQSLKAPQS